MRILVSSMVVAISVCVSPLGCATPDSTKEVAGVPQTKTPDAVIHINGLSCPF